MKKFIVLFQFLFVVSSLSAQQIVGYVYDTETGEALPGAIVEYKYNEVKKEVATDENGHYEIEVPEEAITLSFNYIGYATENYYLIVSNKEMVNQNVHMELDAKLLDEVIASVWRSDLMFPSGDE